METLAFFHGDGQSSLLFTGEKDKLITVPGDNKSFEQLDDFLSRHKDTYKAMMISYDLKNEIEKLDSNNPDFISFPSLICWVPEQVIKIEDNQLTVLQGEENALQTAIQFIQNLKDKEASLPMIRFNARSKKQDYLERVVNVKKEIQYGNTYEVNFCQEFYAENIPDFDRFSLIKSLQKLTLAPFSAYICIDEFELFCASPERYLRKKGTSLISEPIKGTTRRGSNPEEDEQLKKELFNNAKERAENVMITDLVRNDFSRIAKKGSVYVPELCGIHTFGTVHHMISTVECEIDKDINFTSILKATFPMGSMTGAPKISTMKIIEEQENFRRGIYSGSVGYIKPNGDFDTNVVIRTIVKNNRLKRMSCCAGGAITSLSDPEKEYEECLIKVKRIIQLFGNEQGF